MVHIETSKSSKVVVNPVVLPGERIGNLQGRSVAQQKAVATDLASFKRVLYGVGVVLATLITLGLIWKWSPFVRTAKEIFSGKKVVDHTNQPTEAEVMIIHLTREFSSIENEANRYTLLLSHLKKYGEKILPSLLSARLSLEHRKQLALQLGQRSPQGAFIDQWAAFEFDDETTLEILAHLAEKNPSILFDKWSKIPESCRTTIQAKIPFFRLHETIKHLEKQSVTSLFTTEKKELIAVFTSLHELNRTYGIPASFRKSLSSIVQKMAQGSTQNQLLELVSLLHEQYFCETNVLLNIIFSTICKERSSLKKKLTPYWEQYITPFISSLLAHQKMSEKIQRKGLEGVIYHPPVFLIDQLKSQVEQFQASSLQKALFLVRFP